MNRAALNVFLAMLPVALAASGAGYWLGQGRLGAVPAAASAGQAPGRKVLYWYDPMKPDQRFDKPGKSPSMDMALVPKYADEAAEGGGLKIDPTQTQNLGLRLASVEKATLSSGLEVPATVQFNERDVAVVQAKAAGFVDRVYARAPGDVIARGAPLVDLTIPDWASAQAEWLALREGGDKELAQAARDRLRLLGMPEELIAHMERTGRIQRSFTLTAPLAGVIQALEVRQGMSVAPGMTVARINGLARVWLEAAVPEAQAASFRSGQRVTARLAAYPGEDLTGTITAVLADLNEQARTLRVRMEFPNPGLKLRPGMFAQVRLDAATAPAALVVPSEAIIRTGKRNLVILANADGSFSPVEVRTGREAGGRTAVLAGLSEGQKVVASGQFLIDSEASLSGVLARMNAMPVPTPAPTPAPSSAQTQAPSAAVGGIEVMGVIEAVKPGEVTLSHQDIPALGWPAMTMPFAVARGVDLRGFHPGQHVRFWLSKEDEPVVLRLQPMEATP